MDVIVPAHNLRTLSSSLTTLSKIGKYLYVEFDPLSGLTFRTLNDAKSSYAQFVFDVGFFERCTTPPGSRLRRRVVERNGGRNRSRTPLQRRRRRRKRVRSEQSSSARAGRLATNRGGIESENDNHDEENDNNNDNHDNDNDDDDDDLDEKYFCRVNIKTVAAILKSRKGVQSLRIRSLGLDETQTETQTERTTDNPEEKNDDMDAEHAHDGLDQGVTMQLSFEFRIQTDGVMRVTHKVAVSEADSVVAIAHRKGCSEIVALPKILLKMMDPVKSTEVALIISDVEKKVTASSFHHSGAGGSESGSGHGRSGGGGNMLLNATAATVLKTETSMKSDDFDEFIFSDFNDEKDIVPEGADKEVALVFSTKEAKAMLVFCAAVANSHSSSHSDMYMDNELRVIVSFHWGGRPLIIETEGDAFKGELILATIPHDILQGVDLTSRRSSSSSRDKRGSSTTTGSSTSRKNRHKR